MSISQDSTATIVCREVFDETSLPTNEEILDYAKRLGIDPAAEPHLLEIAREGLNAPLPDGWAPAQLTDPPRYYYFHEQTKETSWEHPLDDFYRKKVQKARERRQSSLDEEDSKTTAKDLESHEEATLGKEPIPSTSFSGPTRIPKKLPPIQKTLNESGGVKKKEVSAERQQTKKSNEAEKSDASYSSLMSNRASRDYTNLQYSDPNFYKSPQILEGSQGEADLKEVLKRSESMSPKVEQDWAQLSSKFNSEENVIDIDKLSASSLGLESNRNTSNAEKNLQTNQQKELTLSGGGAIFLKSNRSKDNTPVQETKLEDFQVLISAEDLSITAPDRLKSILRDKGVEEDEKPTDKSVRFDLERRESIKFDYDSSGNECDSESDDKKDAFSFFSRKVASAFNFPRQQSHNSDLNYLCDNKEDDTNDYFSALRRSSDKHLESIEKFAKTSKKIGNRFTVSNVSENEHISQIRKSSSNEFDDDSYPSKFVNVKKIDIVSRNEADFSDQSADSNMSLDQLRRQKELMLEDMKKRDEQRHGENGLLHSIKLKNDFEITRSDLDDEYFEDTKIHLRKSHEEKIDLLLEEFNANLDEFKDDLEKNFSEHKVRSKKNMEERLADLKRELADREELEIQKMIEEMEEEKIENLKKVKNELESCYEKERQDILSNLKTELDQRKKELLELRNSEMLKLETEYEKSLNDEKQAKVYEYEIAKEHNKNMETMKIEQQKEFEELKNQLNAQHQEKIAKIMDEHEHNLAKILRDYKVDENLTRKVYKQRLEEISNELSKDLENETKKQNDRAVRHETIEYEKMRCEKRLLEDKYNTLKEKYLKLKKEVRLVIERKNRRKEQGNTTASETEKSTSVRTRTDRTDSSDQKSSPKKTRSDSITNSKSQECPIQKQVRDDDSEGRKVASGTRAAGDGTKNAAKFESDDTTTASETYSNILKKKKIFTKKMPGAAKSSNGTGNPVENIRKQLEKLEDLGDLLPSNETAYTVRYPFHDKTPANVSSELEFFRHRIHVERDSVRRAREALKQQKSAFQGRQRAWKQRSARATLEQLAKEERELSDMEVTLHRTRSLLGEKVIHLRHLEQSLERVANAKKSDGDATPGKNEDMTLSDMSSASSGFSSTDLGTDTFIDKPDEYQESTKIIQSLENLNSEIREIWGVLNKRQDNNIPPPPALMFTEMNWLPFQQMATQSNNTPVAFGTPHIQSNILSQLTAAHSPATTAHNMISQYGLNSGFTTSVGTVDRMAPNLMERTRNLRDWLRQARIESSDLISPGQATL